MSQKRTVYFVGAGLSKSLQVPAYPIPVMWDFVKVACGYAANDPVLLTTLTQLEAAGVFAESTPASMKLANKVSPPSTGTDEEKKDLLKLMTERPGENIEDALVKASKMTATLKTGLLPLRFNFAIGRIFQIVGWNVRFNLLRRFIKEQKFRRNKGTFVTFNYDLFLERVLQQMSLWSVSDGYAFDFAEYVEIESTDKHMTHMRRGGGGAVAKVKSLRVTPSAQPSVVKVLKPHGSLNWLCHFEGNYGFVGSPTHLALTTDQELGYLETYNVELLERPNSDPWPETGIFISAPTLKNPLPNIIQAEIDAVIEADDLFVIGWSVPETDTYQVNLIRKAISKRQRPFRRVVVIDANPSKEHYARIRHIFSPVCSFEPWCYGFTAYVRLSFVRRPVMAIIRAASLVRCWIKERTQKTSDVDETN